jgi:hypothetical protein
VSFRDVVVPPAILLLGISPKTRTRADELRLHGHGAWVATSVSELRWLLDQAWIRPAYALVDLQRAPDGVGALEMLAPLAAMARLPSILIGARAEDAGFFGNVLASLPSGVELEDVLETLRALATAPRRPRTSDPEGR